MINNKVYELTSQRDAAAKSYRKLMADRKRDWGLAGISTGIHDINLAIGGFLPKKVVVFAARSGIGKAQPLDSKIFTPDGYTLMGDIKQGDLVLNEDGGHSKVIGVYPQGLRKTYLIHLSDGSKIKADENHLWKIYTARDRKSVCDSKHREETIISRDRHSILSTKEMIGEEYIYMSKGRENVANLKLPVASSANHTKKNLIIKPYALGVLIGDGCFSKGNVSNGDKEVVARLMEELGKEEIVNIGSSTNDYSLAGIDIRGKLDELFNKESRTMKSIHKYIPNHYLYSSIEDRLDLLRGLMDTDGYVSKGGTSSEFYTSSERLAYDVKQLVESLGGVGVIKNRGKKDYNMLDGSKKRSVNDSYAVTVNMPSDINPFYLPRKANRVKEKTKYQTPRYITNIEYIGEMETQCIKVDNPTSLYLTDHYTVTHNTGILNSFIEGGSTVREGRRGAYLVFSWELDPSLLVTREICRKKGITQGMLLNGAKLIGDDALKEIESIYKECANYDVRYQTLTTNIEIVDKITREFVKECKVKSEEEGVDVQPIVLLDFVQMSKGLATTLKTYQLQEFMVNAKNLANETDSTIVMLAQLKRESDSKDVPTRDDLSDSKSIEDNCDSLGILHRPEYNNVPLMVDPRTGGDISTDGKMLIRILKERNFGTKDFIINCDIKYFRFWSVDSNWGEDFHHLYNKKSFWMSFFGFKKNNEQQLNLDQNG